MDTIFATATAAGKAGVAIVRLSGPGARAAAETLCHDLPQPRQAALRLLREGDEVLDQALVIWFEAGRSFTGEEVVELHLHGSPAIVGAVLRCLGGLEGLRLAEPGEFTRRALENGRMDLAQVEGLADLIAAETEAQRRQAMRVFSGALGQKADSWRSRLIHAAALIEAVIDFADEDVPVNVRPEVRLLIGAVLDELRQEDKGYAAAERVRTGFEVAIVGRPNTGKSTLLNRLAGRRAAITSEVAGTTRDVIEVRMDLGGLAVTLLDTAGLRESGDVVESMGIALALERAAAADLRVILTDERGFPDGVVAQADDIVLRAKADLAPGKDAISGLTGAGVATLIDRVTHILSARVGDGATIIRARHQAAIRAAIMALDSALHAVNSECHGEELVAEDLRSAVRFLDSIIGRIDVEHLLGEIFASFCIGK